jgi:hypothetical protein
MAGLKSDITRFKKQLIKRAKAEGLYENFGQIEVRKLKDKYLCGYMGEERINMDLIDDFYKWCLNFDYRQLNKY